MKQMFFILSFLSITSVNGMEFWRTLFASQPKPLPIYQFSITEEIGHTEDVGESIGGTFPMAWIYMQRNNCFAGFLKLHSDHSKQNWVADHGNLYDLTDVKERQDAEREILVQAIVFAQRQKSKKLIYYTELDRIKDLESMGAECSYPAKFDNKKCTKCVFDVTQDIYKFN